MLEGLTISIPLIIGAAVAFIVFCAVLIAFEKRADRPGKRL